MQQTYSQERLSRSGPQASACHREAGAKSVRSPAVDIQLLMLWCPLRACAPLGAPHMCCATLNATELLALGCRDPSPVAGLFWAAAAVAHQLPPVVAVASRLRVHGSGSEGRMRMAHSIGVGLDEA